ncbi:TetR/AcrR family transcriptional regulator [Polaromonas sp. YR568]|uniref:TetR/AcrR family transcriptional regulator n=1 Tax=Polaromonas sp. YR568 TaxID=1855301 RepID=UPI00398BE6D4
MDKPAARSRPAVRASIPLKTGNDSAEKRPRGRPRKTLDERDDGNRRVELINAAARLFRQKGFDATSTRDIAAAVGMHSGSPFYHFKSKGALLYAVMDEGMRSAQQRQAAALEAAGPSAPDASALLRLLVRNHFDVLLGPGSDFIPVMLYESRSITARQRALLATLQSDYEAVWEPVLQALAEAGQLKGPVKLARLLMFGALNWSVQWFDAKKPATLDDLTDAAMALFIHSPARGKPSRGAA